MTIHHYGSGDHEPPRPPIEPEPEVTPPDHWVTPWLPDELDDFEEDDD